MVIRTTTPINLSNMGASLEQSAKNLQVLSQFSQTLAGAVKPILDINAEETKQDELLEQYKEDISQITGAFPDKQDQANIESILRKQQKVLDDQGIYKVYENAARLDENDKLRSAMRAQALQTRMSSRLEEASQVNNPTPVGDIAAEEAQGLQGTVVGQDAFGQDVMFSVEEDMSIAELIAFTHQKAGVVAGFQQAADKEREKKALEGNQKIAGANIYQHFQAFGNAQLDASSMNTTFQKLFEGFRDLNVQNPDGVFFESLDGYLADKLRDPATSVNDVRNIRAMMDAIPDIVKFTDSNGAEIHLAKEGTANYNKLLDIDAKFERGWAKVKEERAERVVADKESSHEAIVQNYMRAALQLQRQGVLTPEMVRKIKTQALQRYIQLDGRDVDSFVTKFDNTLDFLAEQAEPEEGVYETLTYELEVAPTPTEETRKDILEALQNQEITVTQYDNLMERWNTKSNVSQETDIDVIGKWDFKPESYITPAEEVLRMNNKKVPIYNNLGQIAGQVTEGAEDDILPPNQISNINKAAVAMQRAALEGGEYTPDFAMFTVEEIQKLQDMGYDLDLIEYAIPEELPSVNFEGVVTDAPSIETRKNIVKDVTRRYSTYVALRYALKKKAALDKLKAITG